MRWRYIVPRGGALCADCICRGPRSAVSTTAMLPYPQTEQDASDTSDEERTGARKLTSELCNKQAAKQTNKRTKSQSDKHTNRHTGIPPHKHTYSTYNAWIGAAYPTIPIGPPPAPCMRTVRTSIRPSLVSLHLTCSTYLHGSGLPSSFTAVVVVLVAC